MSKFKKGDKVKRISSSHCGMKIGDISIVTEITGSGSIKLADFMTSLHDPNMFELVEDTPKFKVGDRVRSKHPNSVGKKGTIIRVAETKQCWGVRLDCGLLEGCGHCPEKGLNSFHEKFLELIENDCVSCESELIRWDVKEYWDMQNTINQVGAYYKVFNEANTPSENKGGIIMNIMNFVKESLLSADEKALRTTGLKDSCGDFTSTANELVIAKLVKENEDYLIEVANKKIEADKASK